MTSMVLAPWTSTRNMGDEIIADAITQVLAETDITWTGTLPTHHRPKLGELLNAARAEHLLLGGTNIMSSRLSVQRQWLVTPDLALAYRHKIVAFGVGWRAYQDDPTGYNRRLIRAIMDPNAVHSVRDQYTAAKFAELGLRAVNTGCPTLWKVPDQMSSEIDDRTVVITITDYKPDSLRKLEWINALRASFAEVYLQPQNPSDASFAVTQLGFTQDHVLPLSLPAYDRFLAERRPYYFGTRLHGGVRAMQHGLPAVIVPVDNRATEMGHDFGLCLFDPAGGPAAVGLALRHSHVWPGQELARAREIGMDYLTQLREYLRGGNAFR